MTRMIYEHDGTFKGSPPDNSSGEILPEMDINVFVVPQMRYLRF